MSIPNRRQFFRHGLRELLRPLLDSAQPMHQLLSQLDHLDRPKASGQNIPAPPQPLQPPAARPAPPNAIPAEDPYR